jgi:hypothetical protein
LILICRQSHICHRQRAYDQLPLTYPATVHLVEQLVEALGQHKSKQSAERRRLGPMWAKRGVASPDLVAVVVT